MNTPSSANPFRRIDTGYWSDTCIFRDEKCFQLACFDPATGHVPNPGMGVNAYIQSDHMHIGYNVGRWVDSEGMEPLELDRNTFDRLVDLKYADNLRL